MTTQPDDRDAGRIADAMLNLWRAQLDDPGVRGLLSTALCKAMRGVAGEGCVSVCPMGETSRVRARAVAEAIGEAVERCDSLRTLLERTEFVAEKVAA